VVKPIAILIGCLIVEGYISQYKAGKMMLLCKCARQTCPAVLLAIFLLAGLVVFPGCEEKKPVRSGEKAPGISGTDIHGEFVSLDQFKGNVVVLYFWKNSCCGDRLKQLEPYYRRNKYKGLKVLAINVGDSREIVESYAKKSGLTFTLQTDERAMTGREYGVFGFPTIFILDREGTIRKKILGDIETSQLEKLVQHQFTVQKEADAAYEKMHRR
jgi:peroxiredoxin